MELHCMISNHPRLAQLQVSACIFFCSFLRGLVGYRNRPWTNHIDVDVYARIVSRCDGEGEMTVILMPCYFLSLAATFPNYLVNYFRIIRSSIEFIDSFLCSCLAGVFESLVVPLKQWNVEFLQDEYLVSHSSLWLEMQNR